MSLKQILHALTDAASGEGPTLEKDARQLLHDAIDKLEHPAPAPAAPAPAPEGPEAPASDPGQ